MREKKERTPPRVGDTIYVDDIDVSSGRWIRGGKAVVREIFFSELAGAISVAVSEIPGASFGLEIMDRQADLASQYGEIVAGQLMMGAGEIPMARGSDPGKR